MKSQRFRKFAPCGGVNQVLTPNLGDANSIFNCRYAEEDGWKATVGFESWWQFPTIFTIDDAIAQNYFRDKVDAVYQWKRQGTKDIYTFVEQSGRLYYMLGNKNGGDFEADIVVVDSDRYIPKLGDIGSQFINLGQHLLIINGRDRALLFSGDQVWRDFGFVLQTPSCNPLDVDTDYQNNEVLTGGAAVFFGENSQYGLGRVTEDQQYTYNYKMTMISDLGAESPLSGTQSVSWSIPNAQGKRYGVALDLPIG
jgi:hypothetical protein